MRVMLANPDRDFLLAFTRILEYENDEVTAVFDGTQVITKLASQQKPDIVVLDEGIPRISSREILKQLNENDIPVIMISDRKINSGKLMDNILANAYLSLPFMPGELTELIKSIDSKHKSKEKLEYEDVKFDISGFRLCDEIRVTNEEIDIFRSLVNKGETENKRAVPYINALNRKFRSHKVKKPLNYVHPKACAFNRSVMLKVYSFKGSEQSLKVCFPYSYSGILNRHTDLSHPPVA